MDSIDRIVGGPAERPVQRSIPASKQLRDIIRTSAADYARSHNLAGPLSMAQLRRHADSVVDLAGTDKVYIDYAAVMLNNAVWSQAVAGISYDRRLLLLPRCLRDRDACMGQMDEYGLVCSHCRACMISEFQSEAQRLGYAVLVAEGSPVVMSLIASGQIEAVVGVSCLGVLERVFPYMEAGAIPGIAIPLLNDGCGQTSVDVDMLWHWIYKSSGSEVFRVRLDEVKAEVAGWFEQEQLTKVLGGGDSQVEKLGRQWLASAGKRWRPILVDCAYRSLAEDGLLLEQVRRAAVAVECFHKASLIHDDIEDGDFSRYGQVTPHAEYGVAIALNVGDYLLGQGYRLLAELDVSDSVRAKLVLAASGGHSTLCVGQGMELAWRRDRFRMGLSEVIDIFEKKTSPAFEVALGIGAILAGGDEDIGQIIGSYSKALGVAYQIYDDLRDYQEQGRAEPSVLYALAYERGDRKQRELLDTVYLSDKPRAGQCRAVGSLMDELGLSSLAYDLMETYKLRAINSLAPLGNSNLKSLLRRLITRIFNELEVLECCDEYKLRHGKGS